MRMTKININKFMCELLTSVGVTTKQRLLFLFKHRIVLHRKPVIVSIATNGLFPCCSAFIASCFQLIASWLAVPIRGAGSPAWRQSDAMLYTCFPTVVVNRSLVSSSLENLCSTTSTLVHHHFCNTRSNYIILSDNWRTPNKQY